MLTNADASADAAPTGLPLGGRPLARVVTTLPHLGHAYLRAGAAGRLRPPARALPRRAAGAGDGPPAAWRGRHPGPVDRDSCSVLREKGRWRALCSSPWRNGFWSSRTRRTSPSRSSARWSGRATTSPGSTNGQKALDLAGEGPRRGRHPRPRPARHRRARGLPPSPRGRLRRRDHDRHRPRRRARPGGRARLRRRRLPRQAVRPRRAAGPGAGAAAAHRPAGRRPPRRTSDDGLRIDVAARRVYAGDDEVR